MTLVTPHFFVTEFDCHSGDSYPAEWVESRLRPLCEALEQVRAKCGGFPVTITSGFRTPAWNEAVGGKEDSQHIHGTAADFLISKAHVDDVYQACLDLQDTGVIPCGGLAIYHQRVSFVHLDVRGRRVRWVGSTTQVPL